MTAKAGVDWCEYCDVYPRNPCQSGKEVVTCPNSSSYTKDYERSKLPGYSREDADELRRYREKYGPL